MNTNPDNNDIPSVPKAENPLNLTPEQAKREASKLREVRNDLEEQKRIEESSIRTTPLGRHDE